MSFTSLHAYADMVLNQNIHASEKLYIQREPGTRLLLGTRYALLRREFLEVHKWLGSRFEKKFSGGIQKILVTLGGSDPGHIALKVIQALKNIPRNDLEVIVVVGVGEGSISELEVASTDSRLSIQLKTQVSNMAELMEWSDVAVSAGGSSCWELAFMGVPNIILVLAENQQDVADGLAGLGISMNLGRHQAFSTGDSTNALEELFSSPGRVARMSQLGRSLVDGHGARRVLDEMAQIACRTPL